MASRIGVPLSCSHHATSVENSAISPWAKLMCPVPRYTTTRPSATKRVDRTDRQAVEHVLEEGRSPAHAPQVRAAHRFVVGDQFRWAIRDDPAGLEQANMMCDPEREVGVLFDQQHRQAAAAR